MNLLSGLCQYERIDISGFANVEGVNIEVIKEGTEIALELSVVNPDAKAILVSNLKQLIEQLEE